MKLGCEDNFDPDEQPKRFTLFDDDFYHELLVGEQATSPGQSMTIPFHPFIAPSSPSTAPSSFGSRLSKPLGTLPPDREDLMWEFFDAPQHFGSTDC